MREKFLIDVLGFIKEKQNTNLMPGPIVYTKQLSEDGVQLLVTLDGSTWIEYPDGDQSVGIGVHNEESLNELIIILELGLNKLN